MTSQELAFLIHFVGDVHQPLHAANNGDRGGNCEKLTTIIHHAPFDTDNLHAVWDDDEVRSVLQALGTEQATAAALFAQAKSTSVSQLTPLDWAQESNTLARGDVYTKLAITQHSAAPGACDPTIQKISISQTYIDGNRNDVETQLIRAGIRLAGVLNEICAGNGCAANPKGK
jgi:hypothetical protein